MYHVPENLTTLYGAVRTTITGARVVPRVPRYHAAKGDRSPSTGTHTPAGSRRDMDGDGPTFQPLGVVSERKFVQTVGNTDALLKSTLTFTWNKIKTRAISVKARGISEKARGIKLKHVDFLKMHAH